LEWPWQKFDALYAAHSKRIIKEELVQRKIGQINALWANTNLDSAEANRGQALKDVEEQFDSAIDALYSDEVDEEQRDELKENPFFAPVEKGLPPK